MGRLWLNGQTPANVTSVASRQEIGTHVVMGTSGQITTLYYYRSNGATANTTMRLWNAAGTLIEAITRASGVQSAQGWQPFPLATPYQVAPGDALTVSVTWETGTNNERYDNPISPSNATDFPQWYEVFNATPGSYPSGSGYQGETRAVDLFVQVGTDPATPADLANALAGWLSTTDGTHADSAPLQDHATLATVNTNTAAVKADADDWAFGLGAAAHGYYADVKTLIGNIKSITDTLPTPIAQLTSIVLDHYTADIANILAQIDSVLSNLGAQSTDLSGTAGSAVGALSGRTGFPSTGWTMAAEEDFEDAIAFAEPADAYVLNVTSYQDTQPANESPAGLWLPRLGWWCVLTGSLASQRQFVDFEQMLLEDQGRRMPGCAIQLRPGTLATVQAWLLA